MLVWKSVDATDAARNLAAVARAENGRTSVAKAGLVLLGYQGLDLGEHEAASQTLTRSGSTRYAFLQHRTVGVFFFARNNGFLRRRRFDKTSFSRFPIGI